MSSVENDFICISFSDFKESTLQNGTIGGFIRGGRNNSSKNIVFFYFNK